MGKGSVFGGLEHSLERGGLFSWELALALGFGWHDVHV